MYKLFLLIATLALATACKREAPGGHPYEERVLVQDNTDDLSELVWDYVEGLKHEQRLFFENASVVAGPLESILRLEFSTQSLLEMGEARIMLVDLVEGLLQRINSSRVSYNLRPLPFTANQLEVYIDFQSYYAEYVDENMIGWVVLEGGMAYYYAWSLKDHRLDLWNARSEPYEKSRSFAKFNKQAQSKYKQEHPDKAAQTKGLFLNLH